MNKKKLAVKIILEIIKVLGCAALSVGLIFMTATAALGITLKIPLWYGIMFIAFIFNFITIYNTLSNLFNED